MISCSSACTQSLLPCLLGCTETKECPYRLLLGTHVQAYALGFCATKPWQDTHRECCTALMCSAPVQSYMGKRELRISQECQRQLWAAWEVPKSLQPSAVCLHLPKEESTEGYSRDKLTRATSEHQLWNCTYKCVDKRTGKNPQCLEITWATGGKKNKKYNGLRWAPSRSPATAWCQGLESPREETAAHLEFCSHISHGLHTAQENDESPKFSLESCLLFRLSVISSSLGRGSAASGTTSRTANCEQGRIGWGKLGSANELH